jgi:hypothetical protein
MALLTRLVQVSFRGMLFCLYQQQRFMGTQILDLHSHEALLLIKTQIARCLRNPQESATGPAVIAALASHWPIHSERSACMGSMLAARQAGFQLATSVVSIKMREASTNIAVFSARTP